MGTKRADMRKQYILEGGGLRQLALASRLRTEDGEENAVLLLAAETYLGGEICTPHRYCLTPEDIPQKDTPEGRLWEEWMSGQVWEAPGLLHPDRLKRRLEDWCDERGIRYFYQVRPICASVRSDGRLLVECCAKCGRVSFLTDVFYPVQKRVEKRNCFAMHLYRNEEAESTGEILYAQVPDTEGAAGDAFYPHAVKSVLDAFAVRKQEDSSLLAGRFAQDGFDRLVPVRSCLEDGMRDLQRVQETGRKEWCAPVSAAGKYDLIVVGGGTAGAMAALYAARNGCRVLLLEQNEVLGGTGTAGGVSAYWFGNRFKDVREVDERTGALEDRYGIPHPAGIWSGFDTFHPGIKACVLEEMNREAGVDIRTLATVYDVKKDEKQKVCGVLARLPEGCLEAEADCVIDATGDGDLAVLAGADYEYGSERDYVTYWASLAQYRTPGTYKNNFSSAVVLDDLQSFTDFIRIGRRRGDNIYDHGTYVALRESRHIRGRKTVTLRDVVTFRNWEDGIYTCFSNYDPKGKLSADMIYAGILPPQNCVQIPLGACLPVDVEGKEIEGLVVAGKAISCTRGAFPGIRMQADLMHQGAVLGLLAAEALRAGCSIGKLEPSVYQKRIRESTGDPLWLSAQKPQLQKAAEEVLTLRTHWIDMPFEECERRESGSLALICADAEEALPVLERRFAELEKKKANAPNGEEMRKITEQQACLAVYLLWHGSDLGTDILLEEMKRELAAQKGLPIRQGPTTCAQLLPDHGVMTEFTYRMNALAWSRKKEILSIFEEVFDRLLKEERDYRDIRKGIFHYVEAFSYAAERTGFSGFLPFLRRLYELPELKDAWAHPLDCDILTERLLILRMLLGRALARIAPEEGEALLNEMAACSNRTIALSAKKEKRLLKTGQRRICRKEW